MEALKIDKIRLRIRVRERRRRKELYYILSVIVILND
jgi:hypothetical protein